MVGDYGFKFFQKVKIIVTNYGLTLNVITIVTNYVLTFFKSLKSLLLKAKTVITNYGFSDVTRKY